MIENSVEKPIRILVISSMLAYPLDNGGAVRLYNIYSRLRKKHHITWVSPIWPGREQYSRDTERYSHEFFPLPGGDDHYPFPDRGFKKLFFHLVCRIHWERLFRYFYGYAQAPNMYWLPKTSERSAFVSDLISKNQFDVIVTEFEGNAELLPSCPIPPAVLSVHNIQSQLFIRSRTIIPGNWEDRLFYLPELLKIISYEKKNYRRYQLAITVSENDRKYLRKRCKNLPVAVIPNGVDLSVFNTTNLLDEKPNALAYFGTFQTTQNIDAILYFCKEILPLIRAKIPGVEIIVIGRNPPEELSQYSGIKLMGFVDNLAATLAQASAVIVPLRMGGGTRLKIIEALGMSKAIISTSIGCEGIQVTHEKDILIADTPKKFSEYAINLLENPPLRHAISRRGRELAEKLYNWDVLVEKYDRLLHDLVKEK
jgi:glycosyltransferase involved in cell wall biosynthesis